MLQQEPDPQPSHKRTGRLRMDEAGWGVKFRQVNISRGRDGVHTALTICRCWALGKTPQQKLLGGCSCGPGHPRTGPSGLSRWGRTQLRGCFFPIICSKQLPSRQRPQEEGKLLREACRTSQPEEINSSGYAQYMGTMQRKGIIES